MPVVVTVSIFYASHSNRYVTLSYFGLVCIFLMTRDVKHLLVCFLSIHLLEVFIQFLVNFNCFFVTDFKQFFIYSGLSNLSDMCFSSTFFQFVNFFLVS